MPTHVAWQEHCVTSPGLPEPVPVLAALGVPYRRDANRLQHLNVYLPRTPANSRLAGTAVRALPNGLVQVHVHGGAWRDPLLTAASIEAAVAHAFVGSGTISAVASIDYTLSRFPTHPTLP